MTWVLALLAVTLWAVAISRLYASSTSRSQQLMTATVTAFALSATLNVAAVGRAVVAVGGEQTLIVADHIAFLAVEALILLFVREISGRGLARRTIVVLVALTLAATTALLLVVGPTEEAMKYTNSLREHPWAWPWLGYWSITTIFALWAYGTGAVFYWRSTRQVRARAEALGVVLIAVGVTIALLINVLRACVVISAPLEEMKVWRGWSASLTLGAGTVLSVAVVGGLVIKTVVTWPARQRAWRLQREAVTALEPLWKVLTSVIPNITLDNRALTSLSGLRMSQRSRLYRRTIEINDGLLALGSYASAPLRQQARDQALATGEQASSAEVIADAVAVRLALRSYRERSPVQRCHDLVAKRPGGFSTEVERLSALAQAMAHCPLTARITGRLLEMESTP